MPFSLHHKKTPKNPKKHVVICIPQLWPHTSGPIRYFNIFFSESLPIPIPKENLKSNVGSAIKRDREIP